MLWRPSVLVFTVVLAAVPFCVVWWLWCRNARPSMVLLLWLALGMQACVHRFQTRPELFSIVFFSFLLAFLVGWSTRDPTDANAKPGRRDWLVGTGVVLLFALGRISMAPW